MTVITDLIHISLLTGSSRMADIMQAGLKNIQIPVSRPRGEWVDADAVDYF